MAAHRYTVLYEPAEGGGYYAHVPALDITTEGRTLAEAKVMARDAVEGFIEAAKLIGRPIPGDVTVEQLEITT